MNRVTWPRLLMATMFIMALAAPALSQSAALPDWVYQPDAAFHLVPGTAVDAAGTPASLYGFSGLAHGLRAENNAVLIESFEILPPDNGRYENPQLPPSGYQAGFFCRNLRLTADGRPDLPLDCSYFETPDPFGGLFQEGGTILVISGWGFTATKAKLTPTGLLIDEGSLTSSYGLDNRTPGFKGSMHGDLKGFRLAPDWSPVDGQNLIYNPWSGISECQGSPGSPLPMRRQDGELQVTITVDLERDNWRWTPDFTSASFDGNSKMRDQAIAAISRSIGDEGGFRVDFELTGLEDGARGDGLVHFPSALGGGSYQALPGSVHLPDGLSAVEAGWTDFSVDGFTDPVAIVYQGWTIHLVDAQIGAHYSGMRIRAPSASVDFNGISIPLGELSILGNGTILKNGFTVDMTAIQIGELRYSLFEYYFDENGLQGRIFAQEPDHFGGYSFLFDKSVLNPDGTIVTDWRNSVPRFAQDLFGGELTMENLNLSSTGITVGRMVYDFDWQGIPCRLAISGALFDQDGNLIVDNCEMTIRSKWGFAVMDWYQNNIRTSDGLEVSCRLSLGSFSYDLAYTPGLITIPSDGSGAVIRLVDPPDRTLYSPNFLWQGLAHQLAVRADSPLLALADVRPMIQQQPLPFFSLSEVYITQSRDWYWSEARLKEPFTWERDGMVFEMTTITSIDDTRILISGIARVPGQDGSVSGHGCSLAFRFDGMVIAAIASGKTVQWFEWPAFD